MGQNFGRSVIAGFAHLEGRAVLLLASDPYIYGGSWTAEACQKVVRFVDLAETFHLPVVYLMDCPGFMIGLEAEKAATIRHGVRAMAAVNQTTVPWCTIIVRNSFGVAGVVHQPAGRFSIRYAWPSAYWGSLPLEGGIEAAYRADIDAAEDPKAKLAEIEDRLNKLRSPFRSAEKFWVEEIIDPRKTRSLLCEFARLAEPLRTPAWPRWRCGPDYLASAIIIAAPFFRNHCGWRVGVARRNGRHHRRIDDAQSLEAVKAQALIDHGKRIARCSHLRGPDRMKDRGADVTGCFRQ